MTRGRVFVFCPMCKGLINYDQATSTQTMHHKEFGIVCSQGCFRQAEEKYAKLILGKREG